MRNYYADLGLAVTATSDEIKKAYRKMARKAHPDVDGRLADFLQVQKAYEVLSNAQGRESYDRDRAQWALREGAIICLDCGTANAIRRRPEPSELVQCARCKSVLPLKVSGVMNLRRTRLVTEGIRLVEGVGSEAASAAAEVLKAKIGQLKKRLIGKRT